MNLINRILNLFRRSTTDITTNGKFLGGSDYAIKTQLAQISEIKEYTEAVNALSKLSKEIDKASDTITGDDYRTFTVTEWLYAMRSATQPFYSFPSWVSLFDIYANAVEDAHIDAALDTLYNRITEKEFVITDSQGKELDEVTQMFRTKWFYDFQKIVVNSTLYGFSLVQLGDFQPDKQAFSEVREINRKHVKPDLNGVSKDEYDQNIIATWEKEPFKTWTVYLYNKPLGKLNKVVRWFIYKTEVSRFWAMHNQKYGTPPVIAKTQIKDPTRKNNLIEGLKNWLTTHWLIIDDKDEITQFNSGSSGGSGQQFFENLIRLADEQISKTLLGGTMLLDSGSSRSQSETHLDNTKSFINSLAALVLFTVNSELIPRMQKIGFRMPKDARFEWKETEKLSTKEKAEIIDILSRNFDISAETASKFTSIELEEKEPEPATEKTIENHYKKAIL